MLSSFHQHTVKTGFSVSGVGVHSGATATLTVKAAPENTGIIFIRTDILDRQNDIPARWDNVTETKLCTVLSNRAGVSVSTVEHVLSAFAALGLDNAVVEIDGPEVPIMDGSADAFVAALDAAGLKRQKAARRAIRIRKPVTCLDGDKEVTLSPANGQVFSFEVEFQNALIGRQEYTHTMTPAAYRQDIARARTFGFLHEVEMLRKIGLARGGSLDNAIVIDGGKVLNPGGLRFRDEFVRHKILDAVGDLYLAGLPIIGHYHGVKAGHAMNSRLVHALMADKTAFDIVELRDTSKKAAGKAASLAESGACRAAQA